MGQLEKIWSDSAAEVHQIVVGPMDNNVYIIRCRRSGEAMLIDAANEHEALLEICTDLGVNQVVETHGHWDHIQAVPAVREAGISVAVTAADAGMLPSYDLLLTDDEQLSVGDLKIRTLSTPGHTPGSICFAIDHHLHRPPHFCQVRPRYAGLSRTRDGHNRGEREPPSPRMGRSWLVTGPTVRNT
jgi:glyoxylase-like metal-dependent hydrolase (beta-lactamase superfamily II)